MLKGIGMFIEDIKAAKAEAKKFIAFVDDYLKADGGQNEPWKYPVEIGLVRAQSLILSRALSLMRNPYCKRNNR